MMRRNFTFLLGTVAGACLTVLVTGPQGAHLVAAAKAAARPDSTYVQLNLFGDVFERIRASYVEKPDDTKLMEGAINGMISSLDPHSRYMNEKGWSDMQETTHGEFGGLGIEVTMEDGFIKVVAPIDDTPAARAGIMSGDMITQIDDDNIQGLTLEQAVSKMKGPADSKTRLKILRKGSDKPIDVAIVREVIRVRPVRYHTDGGDIGYIRITSFNEQTTDGLRKAIVAIAKEIRRRSSRAMSSTSATIRADCSIRRSRCRAPSCHAARWFRRAAVRRRKPSASPPAAATSLKASRLSY